MRIRMEWYFFTLSDLINSKKSSKMIVSRVESTCGYNIFAFPNNIQGHQHDGNWIGRNSIFAEEMLQDSGILISVATLKEIKFSQIGKDNKKVIAFLSNTSLQQAYVIHYCFDMVTLIDNLTMKTKIPGVRKRRENRKKSLILQNLMFLQSLHNQS